MRLRVALALFVLLACEGVLHLAAWISPRVAWVLAHPGTQHFALDSRLGWRGIPGYPGHDARGFRNTSAADTADVVALGDSQTYGYGVQPSECWPRMLEQITGRSVYSMAHGAYSPMQGLALMPDALAMQPRAIVQAVYAQNDLADADAFSAGRLFPVAGTTHVPLWRRVLSHHCKLYALGRAVKNLATPQAKAAVAAQRFNPQRFAANVDLDRPEITNGLRLVLDALAKQHEQARGVRFVVLFIPSKELAGGIEHVAVERERRVWREIAEALRARGITFIDPLPELSADSYFETDNDHLNASGHATIASVVAPNLR